MNKSLSGWGCFPPINTDLLSPRTFDQLGSLLRNKHSLIARGNGRSYGDCSIGTDTISMLDFNHFIEFDESEGTLICEAGVLLVDIIETFLPRGWFLSVTPGTKYITVGGAIASDVHGKNHHNVGSFSLYVNWIEMLTADGSIVRCSRDRKPELFYATCGGMGLTGIIVRASVRLISVPGASIEQTVIKSYNIEQTLELFDLHHKSTYSVAWIDCLAKGKALGRSLIMLGEHAEGPFSKIKIQNKLPIRLLSHFLNRQTIGWFNSYYYGRPKKHVDSVSYESFFYPLDGIVNWNYLYGKSGFIQYQFVLPLDVSPAGLRKILTRISQYGQGSFLAVLKRLGKANNNYMSFPMEGMTLAVDFKLTNDLLPFLSELDDMLCDFGGRVYLTKDACLSHKHIFKMYPKLGQFQEVRKQYGADKLFSSAQSVRLKL